MLNWKSTIPALVAASALALAPVGCGGSSAPTGEQTKYPPGQDPNSDFLPDPPGAKKPAR